MLFTFVRPRTNITVVLVERKHCEGVRNKLANDIHQIVTFGEGSLKPFPKTLLKSQKRATIDQTSQTDLSMTCDVYAFKTDLDPLEAELIQKLNNIKTYIDEFLSTNL